MKWAWPCLALLAMTAARAAGLADVTDLAGDGHVSTRRNAPILVFYAADDCSYCRTVEELYLAPMQARGQYGDRLLIRVVHTRGATVLRDFSGQSLSHAAFARAQGISFIPTIRLYDARGHELVPPLVGYTTPDFYAGYLESAIEQAQAVLVRRSVDLCGGAAPELGRC